jgi:mono/diheme cytochrome c family protein
MISARMSPPARVLLISSALIAVAAFATGCGTERISVAKSDPTYAGAVLFNQRCSGCHTLSYAATHGSAANVRTREIVNGPNFNVRCERPATRVLYAIENGGFSGAIMPQNVLVGQDAIAVAEFVAKYAGRQAPKLIGAPTCDSKPIGSIPAPAPATTAPTTTTPTTTSATAATTTTGAARGGAKSKHARARAKRAKKKTARR